jgi:hypothetical protein
MQDTSPSKKETKHDKFIRLMQNRLGRTLQELRLVSQLASFNYENTPEEALEVIIHLDRGVKDVAAAFGVIYKTHIGTKSSRALPAQMGRVNEIDVARAIAFIKSDDTEAALKQLVAALNQEAR